MATARLEELMRFSYEAYKAREKFTIPESEFESIQEEGNKYLNKVDSIKLPEKPKRPSQTWWYAHDVQTRVISNDGVFLNAVYKAVTVLEAVKYESSSRGSIWSL